MINAWSRDAISLADQGTCAATQSGPPPGLLTDEAGPPQEPEAQASSAALRAGAARQSAPHHLDPWQQVIA